METEMNELERLRKLLANYEELATDMSDDDSYVARGNGFCDTKYSEDFIESQIAHLRQQIAELEKH
ncbi:MAG: hypothetical protein IJT39_08960 [Bacteroidales bacterium]|nr:hypothetical protein [Bacteroidales bacterium]